MRLGVLRVADVKKKRNTFAADVVVINSRKATKSPGANNFLYCPYPIPANQPVVTRFRTTPPWTSGTTVEIVPFLTGGAEGPRFTSSPIR